MQPTRTLEPRGEATNLTLEELMTLGKQYLEANEESHQ